MYQLWLSPKCMKIYMLPAKVYRYMWRMIFYSLRFLKSLPCTNKPHGNRFIIKSLHPSTIDLDEAASEIKVLNSAEHWGDPGPWESLFFQCHQPNVERYLWAEAWKEQLECSGINTILVASEGHLSHPPPPTAKETQFGQKIIAWKCLCYTGVHGETQTLSRTQYLLSGGRHQVKQFCPAIWWDKNYCTGNKYFRK